ncbi:hypothetical protein D3C84_1244570 [compost metagenome]
MQLARQLADFVVQATVAHLVEIIDQLHRFAEIAVFQAIHQLASVEFQSRLEVALRGIVVFHSTLAADISR